MTKQPPGDYLLVHPMATPNGRLHLGHVGGPFLRLDVLARHLRRRGDRVRVITGTDPFDSYVLLGAQQRGTLPEEVCRLNHAGIREDLETMGIECDAFVDPLRGPLRGRYRERLQITLQDLEDSGATVRLAESVPWSARMSRWVVGCWLLGRCPECAAEVAGYYCEACGAHFRPDQVVDPHDRDAPGQLEWRSSEALFLRLQSVPEVRRLSALACPDPTALAILDRHLVSSEGLVRLTAPSSWGVPWSAGRGRVPQVVFNYTGVYPYCLLFGDVYGQLSGRGINAFAEGSAVTTVCAFGVDNTVAFLAGVMGCAVEHGRYRPFDHFLRSHFISLEREKFSTSRGHAVWVRDTKSRVSRDAVRYYLASIAPEQAPSNFDPLTFSRVVEVELGQVAREHLRRCSASAASAARIDAMSPSAHAAFSRMNTAQAHALDPRDLRVRDAHAVIRAWLEQAPRLSSTPSDAFWWLKAFGFLAAPIMPDTCRDIWLNLTGEAEIREDGFHQPPPGPPAPLAVRHLGAEAPGWSQGLVGAAKVHP